LTVYLGVLEMQADGATPDDVRRCFAIGKANGPDSIDAVATRAMEDALAGRSPSPRPEDP
jgi:hypothetical protein